MIKDNKLKIVTIILCVISVFVLVLAVSYAFFTRYDVNLDNNIISNTKIVDDSYYFSTGFLDNILISQDLISNTTLDFEYVSDEGLLQVNMSSLDKNKLLTCDFDIYYVWDSLDRYIVSDINLDEKFPFEYSLEVKKDDELLLPETDLSVLYSSNNTDEGILLFQNVSLMASKLEKNYIFKAISRVYNLPYSQPNIMNKNFSSHIEIKNINCHNDVCSDESVCNYYNES